jgi:hypothetical protein
MGEEKRKGGKNPSPIWFVMGEGAGGEGKSLT